MGSDGKLVNGKESPCVCKQIAEEFYMCAIFVIVLCLLTICRILQFIFYFRVLITPNLFGSLLQLD